MRKMLIVFGAVLTIFYTNVINTYAYSEQIMPKLVYNFENMQEYEDFISNCGFNKFARYTPCGTGTGMHGAHKYIGVSEMNIGGTIIYMDVYPCIRK